MHDVAVIGGGPAGAIAATFLARAKLSTLLVDADQGMTRRAWLANHAGFPEGTSGPELVERGHEQAKRAGARFVKAKVTGLEKTGEGFTLTTEDGQTFEAKQVLLATGVGLDIVKAAGVETKPGTEPRINEVAVVEADGRTNVPGIWAAGTVAGVSVHVTVTTGDGARVAINLISALKGERWVDHDVLQS